MENQTVLSDTVIIDNNLSGQIIKSQKLFSSLSNHILLAVKVTLLFILSFIYSLIALPVVILYMIFFERLFKKIVNKERQVKGKSVYYYKWKKHHLDLEWDS